MIVGSIRSVSGCIGDAYEVLKPETKQELCAVVIVAMASMYSPAAALVGGASYIGYKWLTTEKLFTPDDVRMIYTPPRIESDKLRAYADKIETLRLGKEQFLGAAFARTKGDGQLCPIYIKCISQRDYTLQFRAYDLANDTVIGSAVVNLYVKENNYRLDDFLFGMPDSLKGYGFDPSNRNKAELVNIRNEAPEKYKNIGVALIKSILQYCSQTCDYRMVLDAVRNTQSYYYKLGFRSAASNYQEKNAQFAQRASSGEISNCDYGAHWMYLPKEAADLWQKEIAQNHGVL